MASDFPIETPRLLLRPFEDDDFERFYEIHSREDVTRFLDWEPMSRDAVQGLLDRIKPMTALDERGDALRLAALLRGDGALIGDFSIWRVSREHGEGEIGFVMHPAYSGHGYATEASVELLRLGFERLGFHRVVGRCDARNTASASLMERLGMRCEAHFRQNEFIKGEWTDQLVYAILATEWANRG
jgi:RimJ/RimL family protein N-acetyltransferase